MKEELRKKVLEYLQDALTKQGPWSIIAALVRLCERADAFVLTHWLGTRELIPFNWVRRLRETAKESAIRGAVTPAFSRVYGKFVRHGILSQIALPTATLARCVEVAESGDTHSLPMRFLQCLDQISGDIESVDAIASERFIAEGVHDLEKIRRTQSTVGLATHSINPNMFGLLWNKGQPVVFHVCASKLMVAASHGYLCRSRHAENYPASAVWKKLFWLPKYAALAFTIRAVRSLEPYIESENSPVENLSLATGRKALEVISLNCSDGIQLDDTQARNIELELNSEFNVVLNDQSSAGLILASLYLGAVYELAQSVDNLKAHFVQLDRCLDFVLAGTHVVTRVSGHRLQRDLADWFSGIMNSTMKRSWRDSLGVDSKNEVVFQNKKFELLRAKSPKSLVFGALQAFADLHCRNKVLPRSKKCLFCGQVPASLAKEHVIPQWLMRFTHADRKQALNRRTVIQGIVRKRADRAFGQLKYPACEKCNRDSKLMFEDPVEKIMPRLGRGEDVTLSEYSVLLDWFDKVRVGLWYGNLQTFENATSLEPVFTVNSRLGLRDRILFIARTNGGNRGIVWTWTSDPIYVRIPSFFAILINNLMFVNVSMPSIAARFLGNRFGESIFKDENGMDHAIACPAATGPVADRLPFIRKKFFAIVQEVENRSAGAEEDLTTRANTLKPTDVKSNPVFAYFDEAVAPVSLNYSIHSTFERQSEMFENGCEMYDELRRWIVMHSSPPPFNIDNNRTERMRDYYFDERYLAEIGLMHSYDDRQESE